MIDYKTIFEIQNDDQFTSKALEIFQFQAKNNIVYKTFLSHLNVNINTISSIAEIPFLPIDFFKSHRIYCENTKEQEVFLSSGTTGMIQSKHPIFDLNIYKESYLKAFQNTYGSIEDYVVLALLPSYLEREGSSLIFMVDDLIKKSCNEQSGFYLHNLQ